MWVAENFWRVRVRVRVGIKTLRDALRGLTTCPLPSSSISSKILYPSRRRNSFKPCCSRARARAFAYIPSESRESARRVSRSSARHHPPGFSCHQPTVRWGACGDWRSTVGDQHLEVGGWRSQPSSSPFALTFLLGLLSSRLSLAALGRALAPGLRVAAVRYLGVVEAGLCK